MATWCRTDADLPEHPKTLHLAELLGADLRATVGSLLLLWIYLTRFAPDGVLTPAKQRGVARRMGATDMTDSDVLRHLEAAGFVEQGTDGSLIVHGFMERNGSHLREAERKRVARQNRPFGPSADAARNVRGLSAPTDVTDGRDGTDGTGRTGRDVRDGRTASRKAAREDALPAGLPTGRKDDASRFTPGTPEAVQEAFPRRDVALIGKKLLSSHRRKPVADLDAALWRWAESAERMDTEPRGDDSAPYDRAAVLARSAEIDAERGGEGGS